MSANSKIEWCDHTFNPWIGCTKVSPGCAHCYAEKRSSYTDKVEWGKGKPRRRTSADNWKQPLKWNKTGICECGRVVALKDSKGDPFFHCGKPVRHPRVFCASLADWLDDEVPIEWLADLLGLIHAMPNLDWLLLTKRPENFLDRICSAFEFTGQDEEHYNKWTDAHELCGQWINEAQPYLPIANVWVGASAEDQQRADERIPKLLEIPAKIRFLSCEPLLEPLNLTSSQYFRDANTEPAGGWFGSRLAAIDWVIVGGESGLGARPCQDIWIRDLVKQCREADVPVFVKQLGSFCFTGEYGLPVRYRDRKGGDISEWPEHLRVREFPQAKEALAA